MYYDCELSNKRNFYKGFKKILFGFFLIGVLSYYFFMDKKFTFWPDLFFIWMLYIAIKNITKGLIYFFKN